MSNVLDFGAVGDGTADDTAAVQAAIDAQAAEGGGRVIVPSNKTFRCGTVQLRTGIELHLEPQATLQASPDEALYTVRRQTGGLSDGNPEEDAEPSIMFITAEGCTDISITGRGTIDGGGRFFIEEDLGGIYAMAHIRPYTIFLVGCERVTIRDVQIFDGAYWTVRLSGCVSALIDSVTIRNDLKLPNNDGIDIDACQRVRIANCDIVTADDGICIKCCKESAHFGACSDITVTGCTIVSRSAAICLGSEIATPIRNVVVTACVVSDSHRGLALKLSEPGGVENVLFSDIVIETRFFDSRFWGCGEPIYATSYPWRGGSGTARNIRFHNILARSENGALIRAEEPGKLSGFVFSDVRIEIDRWSGEPGGFWDLQPHPARARIEHATNAIHLERVEDVRLTNCEVAWAQNVDARADDLDQALATVEVEGLLLQNFRGEHARPAADELAS